MPKLHQLFALAATALAALPAEAALPPNHQRLAELRAVLAHPGLAAALADAPIDRVEHIGPDNYRVTADNSHVDVTIVELPMARDIAGPRRFETQLAARVCADRAASDGN